MGKFKSKKDNRLFSYKLNNYNEPMIITSYHDCHNIVVYFPNKNIYKRCDYKSFKDGTVDSFRKTSYNEVIYNKHYVQVRCFNRFGVYKGFFIIDFDSYSKISHYTWCMKSQSDYPYRTCGRACYNLHITLMNPPKGYVVDHINRLKWDNRFDNLKIVSYSQNIQNSGIRKNNSSGIKGVSYYWDSFYSELYHNGIRYREKFDTFLDACIYCRRLELKYSRYSLSKELEDYLISNIVDDTLLKELELGVVR